MSAVLDDPRIAYAARKVRGFRNDYEAWKAEYATRAEQGAWEDVIRDSNRLAQDLFSLDRLAVAAGATKNGDSLALPIVTEIAEWAATARQLADTAAEKRGESVEGLQQLREHIETANRITSMVPLEREFQELVRLWKAETLYLSSTPAMAEHWAYQRIIQLGPAVVPLLLRELRQKPDFWFMALRKLTGVNPVAEVDRGKVQAMAAAWVKWGETNQIF